MGRDDESVELVDLDVIRRFSLALREPTAARSELVALLRADLEWLTGGAPTEDNDDRERRPRADQARSARPGSRGRPVRRPWRDPADGDYGGWFDDEGDGGDNQARDDEAGYERGYDEAEGEDFDEEVPDPPVRSRSRQPSAAPPMEEPAPARSSGYRREPSREDGPWTSRDEVSGRSRGAASRPSRSPRPRLRPLTQPPARSDPAARGEGRAGMARPPVPRPERTGPPIGSAPRAGRRPADAVEPEGRRADGGSRAGRLPPARSADDWDEAAPAAVPRRQAPSSGSTPSTRRADSGLRPPPRPVRPSARPRQPPPSTPRPPESGARRAPRGRPREW